MEVEDNTSGIKVATDANGQTSAPKNGEEKNSSASDDASSPRRKTAEDGKERLSSPDSSRSRQSVSKPKFKKAKKGDSIRKRSIDEDEGDDEKSSSKKKHHRHSRSPDRRRKRSRSRDRRHRNEKSSKRDRDDEKKSKKRRHSREESKSRKRSKSRDRKRSRSRDRHHRRRRSRSPRHKHHHSHRRRHSRDRHSSRRHDSRSSSGSPYRFGYDKAMDAQERLARRLDRAAELNKIRKIDGKNDDMPKDQASRLLAMASKPSVSSSRSSSTTNLNQEALTAQAAAEALAIKAKVQEETGISLPSYYNPLAINPMAYAQQMAKRKKLWSKATTEEKGEQKSAAASGSTNVWSKLSLGDEKANEKFAKLMGIKEKTPASSGDRNSDEALKKQNELFTSLNMQYEQARQATHTQRGVGLGFSSAYFNPNVVVAQQQQTAASSSAAAPPSNN